MEKNVILCDLDGTLYQDGIPFRGVVESLNALIDKNYEIYYMTNNTSTSVKEYKEKLGNIGFPCSRDEAIISPMLIAKSFFTSRKSKYKKLYVSASDSVKKEFFSGTGMVDDINEPDCILITYNKFITYEELQKICEFINSGIPYYLTHIDLSCPTLKGPIPDCGSLGELITKTTNIKPLNHFGKPGDHYAEYIQKFIIKGSTFVVGDRIYTDGLIGTKIEANTIIVLTGETKEPSVLKDINFYSTAVEFFNTL
jgi:4-nitrophenyl phosphatase